MDDRMTFWAHKVSDLGHSGAMSVARELVEMESEMARLRSDIAAERETREKAERERDGAIEYLRRAHVTNNDLRAQMEEAHRDNERLAEALANLDGGVEMARVVAILDETREKLERAEAQLAQRTEELAAAQATLATARRLNEPPGDHACDVCRPYSDALRSGFRCWYHRDLGTSALDTIVAERTAALEQRVAELERDVAAAAGELAIPVPEPGTDMARLLSANVLLRRENERLSAVLLRAERRSEGLRATTKEGDHEDA